VPPITVVDDKFRVFEKGGLSFASIYLNGTAEVQATANPNYGILIDTGLNCLTKIKSPITHVGDVIANIAIACHSSNIRHEDSRFTRDIGTDIPRIRLRI